MAVLVGVPPPSRATPAGLLRALAVWNEALLRVPCLRGLRVKVGVGVPVSLSSCGCWCQCSMLRFATSLTLDDS